MCAPVGGEGPTRTTAAAQVMHQVLVSEGKTWGCATVEDSSAAGGNYRGSIKDGMKPMEMTRQSRVESRRKEVLKKGGV